MALDSYANLKTAISTWLVRADVASDVDDMIDMFEAWTNRNLRVAQMEKESTSAVTEYMALPTDFLELRDIQWQGNPRRELEYMTPILADIYDPTGATGQPKFYTIVGDQLRVIPAPSDTSVNVRIDYWSKVPALSDTQTTNWLLTAYPDAYLYGSLFHGRIRIQDLSTAQSVAAAWQAIMEELKRSGKNANLGSSLQVRVV
jgi:hypothetical protein